MRNIYKKLQSRLWTWEESQGHRYSISYEEAKMLQKDQEPVLQREHNERVQKGIAYWDKQNNDVLAPNCMLKVQGKVIKDEGL